MKYRKAVFIVVYAKIKKGLEYLILKRKLHWKGWEFPKGGIEKYESVREAIIREVKEETGLKTIKIKKFNFSGKYDYNKIFPDRKGFKGQKFSLYAAEVKKGEVKISREHSDYKGVSFREAMKKLTWKNQRKSLEVVDEWLKEKLKQRR